MKESDWRIFKKIKKEAIERFCHSVLEETNSIISKNNEHIQKRYLLLLDFIQSSNKKFELIYLLKTALN